MRLIKVLDFNNFEPNAAVSSGTLFDDFELISTGDIPLRESSEDKIIDGLRLNHFINTSSKLDSTTTRLDLGLWFDRPQVSNDLVIKLYVRSSNKEKTSVVAISSEDTRYLDKSEVLDFELRAVEFTIDKNLTCNKLAIHNDSTYSTSSGVQIFRIEIYEGGDTKSPLEQNFSDTADAIRAKLGTSDKIAPENFAIEIGKISGGGGATDIDDVYAFLSNEVEKIHLDVDIEGIELDLYNTSADINASSSKYFYEGAETYSYSNCRLQIGVINNSGKDYFVIYKDRVNIVNSGNTSTVTIDDDYSSFDINSLKFIDASTVNTEKYKSICQLPDRTSIVYIKVFDLENTNVIKYYVNTEELVNNGYSTSFEGNLFNFAGSLDLFQVSNSWFDVSYGEQYDIGTFYANNTSINSCLYCLYSEGWPSDTQIFSYLNNTNVYKYSEDTQDYSIAVQKPITKIDNITKNYLDEIGLVNFNVYRNGNELLSVYSFNKDSGESCSILIEISDGSLTELKVQDLTAFSLTQINTIQTDVVNINSENLSIIVTNPNHRQSKQITDLRYTGRTLENVTFKDMYAYSDNIIEFCILDSLYYSKIQFDLSLYNENDELLYQSENSYYACDKNSETDHACYFPDISIFDNISYCVINVTDYQYYVDLDNSKIEYSGEDTINVSYMEYGHELQVVIEKTTESDFVYEIHTISERDVYSLYTASGSGITRININEVFNGEITKVIITECEPIERKNLDYEIENTKYSYLLSMDQPYLENLFVVYNMYTENYNQSFTSSFIMEFLDSNNEKVCNTSCSQQISYPRVEGTMSMTPLMNMNLPYSKIKSITKMVIKNFEPQEYFIDNDAFKYLYRFAHGEVATSSVSKLHVNEISGSKYLCYSETFATQSDNNCLTYYVYGKTNDTPTVSDGVSSGASYVVDIYNTEVSAERDFVVKEITAHEVIRPSDIQIINNTTCIPNLPDGYVASNGVNFNDYDFDVKNISDKTLNVTVSIPNTETVIKTQVLQPEESFNVKKQYGSCKLGFEVTAEEA